MQWGLEVRQGVCFFFKVVLNFVVSPSLQMKKWENFGARSHGHSARSRGHAFKELQLGQLWAKSASWILLPCALEPPPKK